MNILLKRIGDFLLAFLITLILVQRFVTAPVMARIMQVISILLHKFRFVLLLLAASSCKLRLHGDSI